MMTGTAAQGLGEIVVPVPLAYGTAYLHPGLGPTP